ncbi:MAG: YMGG-like glycine zipper-containing protein [Pirellulaceae bacterium]
MGKRIVLAALLVCFISSTASAQFNRHQRRGTVIGGLAGAAIGAAIGDRNNNEAVGAVIGGVAGAAIGNNIGANKDHRIEHSRPHYYTQPQYQSHYPQHHYPHYVQSAPVVVPVPVPVAPPVNAARPMSLVDVLNMLRSGLSETMVANQIQRNGMSHSLTVNDIISLHQQGVSEQMIQYMQANVVPGAQVEVGSHTSYSMPAQPALPMQSDVQLNHPSGQSIMVPNTDYQPVN